ncbi:hypothetical protein SVIO_014990 [Streptomyces violaceusniger]|uniref:Uncharacterized protein n=1 Tax=Streptomyces violaceusniger TaxID=68280 RepID=A0A4D4KVI3_STRVO|nr:hypothetical protein SVIO_014990 [Streptomyces violaceusniger]
MTTTDLTTLSGLDLIRWVQSERPTDVPTIGRLLGMRFDEVDPGRVVVSLDTRPDFANPSAPSTAVSPPPCSTRPWAAPFTPLSRPGWATPPWSSR